MYGEFISPTLTLGDTTLTGGCCYYMFAARMDSAGNVLWATSSNQSYVSTPSAFSDSSGNFYLGGMYNGYSVHFGPYTIANIGADNLFVVKYGPTGSVDWAIGADSGGIQRISSISLDPYGDIYATGYIQSPTISLGGTVITNDSTNRNLFVAKLNTTVVHHSPHFLNGHIQSLSACENMAPFSIDSLLAANDSNLSTGVSWDTVSGPTHGALVASYSMTSSGGTVIPTGITYAPTAGYWGADSFKISVSDGMTADTTTIYVTIDSLPVISSITGPAFVCAGTTISLADSVSGGIWSSSNPLCATIDSSGVVNAVSAGIALITYALTGTCAPDYVLDTIYVFQIPVVAPIAGVDHVCVGATTILTDSVTDGIWAAYNDNASVVEGFVSGVTPGPDTIIYSVTNLCGTDSTQKVIIVEAPLSVDSILGPASVMVGFGITLTDSTTGGIWFSYDTSIATIDSVGNLAAIAPGVCTIGYVVANSCGADTARTNILVNAGEYRPAGDMATWPNPSSGAFTLRIVSAFNEVLHIKIVSATCSVIQYLETETNKSQRIFLEGKGVFFYVL